MSRGVELAIGLAYSNIRFERLGALPAAPREGIVDLAEVPFGLIDALDRHCFPAPREDFLRQWIGQPDAVGRACVERGELRGYGVLRRCRHGADAHRRAAGDRRRPGIRRHHLRTGLTEIGKSGSERALTPL